MGRVVYILFIILIATAMQGCSSSKKLTEVRKTEMKEISFQETTSYGWSLERVFSNLNIDSLIITWDEAEKDTAKTTQTNKKKRKAAIYGIRKNEGNEKQEIWKDSNLLIDLAHFEANDSLSEQLEKSNDSMDKTIDIIGMIAVIAITALCLMILKRIRF